MSLCEFAQNVYLAEKNVKKKNHPMPFLNWRLIKHIYSIIVVRLSILIFFKEEEKSLCSKIQAYIGLSL